MTVEALHFCACKSLFARAAPERGSHFRQRQIRDDYIRQAGERLVESSLSGSGTNGFTRALASTYAGSSQRQDHAC